VTPFDFRPLRREDLPLLFERHQQPHVLVVDACTSIDALKADTLDSDAHAFLAYANGKPLAYVQWWPSLEENGVVGIDQFIAAADSIGRGVGTDLVSQFVEFLFSDSTVRAVIVDPVSHNARAIRCYEKAGFRFVEMKGSAYVMRRER